MSFEKSLTDRELQVLALLCRGISYNEIAEKIKVSQNTVKAHSNNIFQKAWKFVPCPAPEMSLQRIICYVLNRRSDFVIRAKLKEVLEALLGIRAKLRKITTTELAKEEFKLEAQAEVLRGLLCQTQ